MAALNSVEPYVMNVVLIDLAYANEEWPKLRRPSAVEFLQKRLAALSNGLGHKPYLDGDRPPPTRLCEAWGPGQKVRFTGMGWIGASCSTLLKTGRIM
jgi:hypothetical protein